MNHDSKQHVNKLQGPVSCIVPYEAVCHWPSNTCCYLSDITTHNQLCLCTRFQRNFIFGYMKLTNFNIKHSLSLRYFLLHYFVYYSLPFNLCFLSVISSFFYQSFLPSIKYSHILFEFWRSIPSYPGQLFPLSHPQSDYLFNG